MNTAYDVRRPENEGEGDEVTEQNPGEKNVRQFTARRTHHRCVVVLQKHPTDEQSYLLVAKYFLNFILFESKIQVSLDRWMWLVSQLQERYILIRKSETLTFFNLRIIN